MKPSAVIGSLLVVVALAAFLHGRDEPNYTDTAPDRLESKVHEPFEAAEAGTNKYGVKSITRAGSAPTTLPAALALSFEKSTNYRAFLEDLLRNRTDGRSLYAMSILATCRNAKDHPSLKLSQQSESNQQLKARELMQARCGDFTDDEMSGDRQLAITRDPRIRDDPFRTLFNRWSQAQTDPIARDAALRDALESRDPLLLESISTVFFRANSQSVFLNGKELTQPQSSQVLTSAWTAAVCEGTGTPCGTDDRYVVDACASRNLCFANRYELMYQTTLQDEGADAALLFKQFYSDLVTTVKTRDTSIFKLQ